MTTGRVKMDYTTLIKDNFVPAHDVLQLALTVSFL
jgi:hypothetical protein